jgi:hypothetical protein
MKKFQTFFLFSFFTILALFSQFSELRRASRRGHKRKGNEIQKSGPPNHSFSQQYFFVVERCGFMSSIYLKAKRGSLLREG